MHHGTLFKSFNNKITTTGKKRDKEQIPKGRRKLEIIYQWDNNLLDTKMENSKEQYTNKKGDKELKLKCLRTVCHVGDAGHRPLRKITIEC